jgi:hypothetical protein
MLVAKANNMSCANCLKRIGDEATCWHANGKCLKNDRLRLPQDVRL